MLPSGAATVSMSLDSHERELAKTLSHVVSRGLMQPWRAFAVNLKSKADEFTGAILAFTVDGRMILGVSVDDSDEDPAKLDRAKALLQQMATDFCADAGFIGVEESPPLLPGPVGSGYWLHQWSRDAE